MFNVIKELGWPEPLTEYLREIEKLDFAYLHTCSEGSCQLKKLADTSDTPQTGDGSFIQMVKKYKKLFDACLKLW